MSIYQIVGTGLLILGGLSGAALFYKAVFAAKGNSDDNSTLWGLFIIGLIAGIWLVSV